MSEQVEFQTRGCPLDHNVNVNDVNDGIVPSSQFKPVDSIEIGILIEDCE